MTLQRRTAKKAEVRQEREAREIGGCQEQTSTQVIQDEAEGVMEKKFQVGIH